MTKYGKCTKEKERLGYFLFRELMSTYLSKEIGINKYLGYL